MKIAMIVKIAVHLKKLVMVNLYLKINNCQSKNINKKLKNMYKNSCMVSIKLRLKQQKNKKNLLLLKIMINNNDLKNIFIF